MQSGMNKCSFDGSVSRDHSNRGYLSRERIFSVDRPFAVDQPSPEYAGQSLPVYALYLRCQWDNRGQIMLHVVASR